jgi:formylglycine-generating enzyme required for sulfatase activity
MRYDRFFTRRSFPLICTLALVLPSVLLAQQSWGQEYPVVVRWKEPSSGQRGTFGYKGNYALVVGVSTYTYWPSLEGVPKDVKAVRQALERHGFLVEVVKNPTRDEMEKAYTDFIAKYGYEADNRLLFYFAGHGETIAPGYAGGSSSEALGYLVARDAPLDSKADIGAFTSKAISLGRFFEWAREIHAKHVLFVFDSCFSGARGFALSVEPPSEMIHGITKRTGEPVRQFISAGTATQTVYDKSDFRRRFEAALDGEANLKENGGNEDAYVTGSELGAYLQRFVASDTHREQTPQFGKIQDGSLSRGDFVFSLESSRMWCRTTTTSTDSAPPPSSVGMEFIRIDAGEFPMGNDTVASTRPLHRVTIRHPFYLGKYEVTQKQWAAVMGNNPSHFTGNANLPVENVSWIEVQDFIKRLNAKETGVHYRLPTEAEWEYAARACARTAYSFGDDDTQLAQHAWYDRNAEQRTHPVGQRVANPWGLYDMHGNVWEWSQDWYGDYQDNAAVDPQGPPQGVFRVYRGCGWLRGASSLYCQLTSRHGARPTFRHPALGFRLVMTIPAEDTAQD